MAKKKKDTLTTASGSPVADNQSSLTAGARGPMKKLLLLSLFLQTGIVAVLLVPAGCGKSEQSQLPPPEVEVVQVEQKDVPISKEWVGTLDGLVNAQIRPQVTGYLLRQTYQEGSFVEKGQLLFEIDPRTFQAALDQAKAQLANAVQQLALAEANQVRAQLDVNRYVPLAKEEAVTQ
jgi:RND family efflux transporter MFP subunit